MSRFYKAGVPCHLCGLPIADWIIYVHHPLSGTIDHLKPRSHGGKDHATNRAPSHACCNWYRGTKEITEVLRQDCKVLALSHFAKCFGQIPDTKKWRLVKKMVGTCAEVQV